MRQVLKPGSTHEGKFAGHWVFWRTVRYNRLKDRDDVHIHCGMVRRKNGDILHTCDNDRVPVRQAWLLAGSVDVEKVWPRYEWGSFKSLTPTEARAIFEQLEVEIPDEARAEQ